MKTQDKPSEPDDLDFGPTIRGLQEGLKVFSRYSLVRKLGQGGMGVVWLARDEALSGRQVALKFLPELVQGDESAIAELKRETQRSLELTHPHIVRIYDWVSVDHAAAISMEYVDGATLTGMRLERPGQVFEVQEIRDWVGQLCSALSYAHGEKKIVHRDLKPANLMVDGAGKLRVLDFGISGSLTDSMSRLSATEILVSGTLKYMSPQQLLGGAPSVSDDVYALGATLYELLTGKPPFYRGNIQHQIETMVAPSLAERREQLGVVEGGEIPAVWEEVVAACLAKEPGERPASVTAVWERLSKVSVAEKTMPQTPKRKPEKPETPSATGSKRKRVLSVLGGLVAGGLVVWGAIHLGGGTWGGSEPLVEKSPDNRSPSEKPRMEVGTFPDAAPQPATLEIRSDLPGAKVLVDGEEIGMTSSGDLLKHELAAGSHEVEARNPPFSTLKRTVVLEAGGSESVNFAFLLEPIPVLRMAAGLLQRGQIGDSREFNLKGGEKLVMKYVPGGTFTMGSPEDEEWRNDDEDQVEVTLSSHYWMGETEVTQGQWEAVMGAGSNPSDFTGDKNLPVESVRWEEAQAYVAKLNEKGELPKRWRWSLPTEAQWERACRAGTETVFSFGDSLSSRQANFDGRSPYGGAEEGPYLEKTAVVKSYEPNGWGLYEMHGNVWEWCLDRWDGHTKLPGGVDPVGTSGSFRVRRGGALDDHARGCRAAFRRWDTPSFGFRYLGFRVALSSLPDE